MWDDAPEVLDGGGGDVCAASSAVWSLPMSHGCGGEAGGGAVLELAPSEP